MTLPSQVTFWLLSSLATALLDASPGTSCISVLPAVSTEHWDLLPQLLHWSWRLAEESGYSPRMLQTDSQHIFTVMHLCIPVARKGSCFRLLGFTTIRWLQKNKTLYSQFFFWNILIYNYHHQKVYFQPRIFFIECCSECFSFWQIFAPLGTLIDVKMDADRGNGTGVLVLVKRLSLSKEMQRQRKHFDTPAFSSGLCTSLFYLPNPEARSVSLITSRCVNSDTHFQGIRDWPLWSVQKVHALSVGPDNSFNNRSC